MSKLNYNFGWLEPPIEKAELHQSTYSFSNYFPLVTAPVEVELPLPNYRKFYNQGNTGACTGYSASWASSINNYMLGHKYNAYKLYKRGQAIDNDPRTSGDLDGGYIWAVCDVLRKEGHWIVNENGLTLPIDKQWGIASYYWAKSIDEIRTGFALGRAVIFGFYWFEEFMNPIEKNKEYWIGEGNNWGKKLGGHAIAGYCSSDQRSGFRLINSWGGDYPPVWISFKSVEKLLKIGGECAITIDIPNSIPDLDIGEFLVQIPIGNSIYSGMVKKG